MDKPTHVLVYRNIRGDFTVYDSVSAFKVAHPSAKMVTVSCGKWEVCKGFEQVGELSRKNIICV